MSAKKETALSMLSCKLAVLVLTTVLLSLVAVEHAQAQPVGTDDIIWRRSNGQVHYWPMQNGQRLDGINIHTPVAAVWRLAGVGDVDGDGTDDIIWQHSNGRVHYWPMQNGQRLDGINIHTPVAAVWRLAGVGDVD